MEKTRPSWMPYGLPVLSTAVEKQSPASVGVTSDCENESRVYGSEPLVSQICTPAVDSGFTYQSCSRAVPSRTLSSLAEF